MKFATPRQEDEWKNPKLNALLKGIALEVDEFSKIAFDKEVLVTSIHRTKEEDIALKATGIHVLWRAIDISAPKWRDPDTETLAEHINFLYQYDPERPWLVVALFRPHQSATGPHLHLQTMMRTKSRQD